VQQSGESIFGLEYFPEYEFLFETASAREWGDPDLMCAEKKPRVENLVILPL
jgi:hypothetical protein